jgi:hypothetical protein
VNKKKQKPLLIWAHAVSEAQAQRSKNLRRFF